MKDINLVLPVVVRSSLTDMCSCHRELAEVLLRGEEVITGEGKIVSRKELNENCTFGSEAVRFLRNAIDLPDVSITHIPVNSIYDTISDFGTMADINYFLYRIKASCRRLARLAELKAPPIIMINEYRMLQERVEDLLDNGWSSHPHEVEYKDGGKETRKSLKDIGFSIGTGICRR